MSSQNRRYIKNYNKTKLMKLLLNHENISRAELARRTHLSIPTVMKITDEFVRQGLVSIEGKGVSSGGKPPELLRIIPNACFFIGVGLSGSHFKCVIINLKGHVIHRHTVPHVETKNDRLVDGEKTIECVIELIRSTINNSGVDRSRLVGIGLEVPHPLDVDKGIVLSAPVLGWKIFDIFTPIKNAFHLPIVVQNTPRVIAIGEQWFGNGVSHSSFLLVMIGRGIGSAIIINGEIYQGANKMSGEIGHTVIQLGGPECICGNHGCLESLASNRAIKREAVRQMENGRESLLSRMVSAKHPLSIDHIFTAAQQGDLLCREILDNAAVYLSTGITNAVNMFDVDLVLLAGEIITWQSGVVDRICHLVNKNRQYYYGKENLLVKELKLGKDAAVIGAATLLLNELVESGGRL